MPELKPLPCPACGDHAVQVGVIEDDRNPCVYFSVMCLCGMHGPDATTEEAAIDLWNSLPRALTWGNEPPKVAGWYWHKNAIGVVMMDMRGPSLAKIPRIDGWQWAGPIPAPVEE